MQLKPKVSHTGYSNQPSLGKAACFCGDIIYDWTPKINGTGNLISTWRKICLHNMPIRQSLKLKLVAVLCSSNMIKTSHDVHKNWRIEKKFVAMIPLSFLKSLSSFPLRCFIHMTEERSWESPYATTACLSLYKAVTDLRPTVYRTLSWSW